MITKTPTSAKASAGKHKIWMWIFIAMFAVPEILFSFLLSIIDFSGKNIIPLYSFIISHQFFIDNSIYLLIANFIEWLGALGLIIISIKHNKKILAFLLAIILLWLSVELYFGYAISNMGLIF